MKKEITFKINFFGKEIIMSFNKETILIEHKYYIGMKRWEDKDFNISIRDYIRYRISEAIAFNIGEQVKGFNIGF